MMSISDKVLCFLLKPYRHFKETLFFTVLTTRLNKNAQATLATVLLMGLSSIPVPGHADIQVRPPIEGYHWLSDDAYGTAIYTSANAVGNAFCNSVGYPPLAGVEETFWAPPYGRTVHIYCTHPIVGKPFTDWTWFRHWTPICPVGFTLSPVAAGQHHVCIGSNSTTRLTGKNQGTPDFCPTGNPINHGTGNKYQEEVDYRTLTPFAPTFYRTYNSNPSIQATSATMGSHWRHTYERSISFVRDSGDSTCGNISVYRNVNGVWTPECYGYNSSLTSATVSRPDGNTRYFTLQGTRWVPDSDVKDTLIRLTDLAGNPVGWQFTTQDDEIETYDDQGKLVTLTHRSGLMQTLSYDTTQRLIAVTDTFGRTLAFTYTGGNRIATMTDPAGGVFSYAYDTLNNLTSVTYPDGKTRTYLYENTSFPSALTGILDENGSRFATYGYDTQGRAILTEHAGGVGRAAVTYNTDGSSSVTDALGTTRRFNFTTILGVAKNTGVTQPCASCGGDSAARTYDANGNLASSTDFKGNLTTYVYDLARNLEISRTEAAGTPLARTLTTAWHPVFRLPTRITEPTRVTSFVYDAQGNLTQKTLTANTLNRVWKYTYNSLGQILSVDGPRTDVADLSTYTYDPQGNLATVTNALGHTTNITAYDAHGRPLTIHDPNGLITQLRYDARGRLISRLVGTELTHFQYDGVGQLTRLILPDNSFMDYTYDAAHRLIAMTDALGNKISYTLDALGNRIKEDILDPSNTLTQQRRRVFDSLNRLAQDIGAQNQITAYQYDANGNLISTTDPLAHTTTQAYDALNRLVQVTDPANGSAKYTYDANDRLTQVMDPRNIGTAYNYDGLDNLTQTLSLDAGTTNRTHDAAGNTLTQTDARNKKTTYTYDALNRLIKTRFADATTITYQYDVGMNALGRLTKMTDPAGITQWTYDPQGRVITQTQTTGTLTQTLRYAYDPSGRVTQLTYPSGKVISYSYDLAGNISQISLNGQPILHTLRYQPYGAVKEWTWSNGTLHSRAFDTDGRIISASDPQGQSNPPLSISYDSAGRIVQQTQSTGVHSYGYDSLDRLSQHVNPTGLVSDYQYDANGNRTQLTQGSLVTAYTLPLTSNRLNSQSGTTNKSYTYDTAGNLINDGTFAYTYNARGRLAKVTYGTRSNTYVLNGLGQRIRKTGYGVSTGTNRYIYDAQGHLLGDYNSTGVALQETVYLGDIPVAVLTPTAAYFIHADHLNTPRAITDSTNKVIWRWDSDPFGATLANEDPDTNGVKFTYNLRFPGQYFDKETGLHYNYFRDYNPTTGRYVQSDPIGLAGGINTYAYVDNNPLYWVDPEGLAKKKYEKPENPNRRKGAENRKPTGDRERNVAHPEGEEHSRRPKGGFRLRAPWMMPIIDPCLLDPTLCNPYWPLKPPPDC